MGFPNCMTFNVCKDNGAAAAEFLKRIKAAGKHDGEIVVHDEDTASALADHNQEHGNAAPVAVAHNAPGDVALEIAVAVEKEFSK